MSAREDGRARDVVTVLRGQRVVTPDGVRPAAVHIEGARIARVTDFDDVPVGVTAQEAGDLLVMPGLIDTHVHVNEPGRTEWEGFASATRAAAAGGITTILDMPLNAVPATTNAQALAEKRLAAAADSVVNVEFIGGVVPGNVGALEGLYDGGVRAFKCFLTPSGVAEFPCVSETDLHVVFPVLARFGVPLMVHAEDPDFITGGPLAGSRRYADYLASRPPEAEHAAIAMLLRCLDVSPTPLHIVHLSSASSLGPVVAARAAGLPVTVETCPHYLTFAAEEIADGDVAFKCAPPLRDASEREALWEALLQGDIDLIASDHSPCPPALKETDGDFFSAWGGIASLQISLSAVWTGARLRGVEPERLATWMSAAPAKLAGLDYRKGAIAPGYDADIVIWDPDANFVVDASQLLHRHPITPYAGRELFGVVSETIVAGRRVYAA